MLGISSREFRDHQKKYFELVDNNEQIIVQRAKNRAYAVVPITETDRYFSNPLLISGASRSGSVTLAKSNAKALLALRI